MPSPQSIEALRRLFSAEFRCPTARWHQAMPYIEWNDTHEETAIRAVAAEDREHLAWLSDLLLARGSSPPPASYATATAETHYVQLQTLLPRLTRAERELIAAYQSAGAALADDPEATRRVSEITGRHTRHLEMFQRLFREPAARG